MTLKELRKQKKLTQIECAAYLGIPVRTYQNYETDESKSTSMKYLYMLQKLEQYGLVDESHGVLSLQTIQEICSEVFADYNVTYGYLFGSYAKGKATETSDVDLLLSTAETGMRFFALVETLRERLKKKVDVLNREQLNQNDALLDEILKDGIKIYG
ncbi:MAG: nucleotidyltransferase domain-containing protein [Clostridia bacterium]|nr:nucleotidyltransferase domain-containing protein [Clostridia bacterium]